MFSIATEEDAYWFGFLCADGSLGRSGKLANGSPYFSGVACQLARKDEQHLLKMQTWFSQKGYKASVKQLMSGRYPASRLRVNSVELAASFIKLGWSGNKTKTILRPAMPTSFVSHFYRGLFDGDGSVQIRTKPSKLLRAQLLSSSIMLEKLKEDISGKVKQEIKLHPLSPASDGVARISLNGQYAVQFLTWLYLNATVVLERKFHCYEQYNLGL